MNWYSQYTRRVLPVPIMPYTQLTRVRGGGSVWFYPDSLVGTQGTVYICNNNNNNNRMFIFQNVTDYNF